MKKISIALIAVIIVAGCTASQVDIFLKASPLVNSFLEQYPNAKVATILVAQGTVQAQIEKIREDCGPDFPLASYYKTTLDDKESGTMLTVWMDSASYQIPCAVKEKAGVKEEVDANKTIEATTTTIMPTTTHQTVATTTSPAATSPVATSPPITATTPQATATTTNATQNTAATGAGLPDLIAYLYTYGPPPGTGVINLTGVVENIGTAASIAGQAKLNLTNEGSGYQWFNITNVPALAPGEKKFYFPDFNQFLTVGSSYTLTINADTTNTTVESSEQNNHGSTSFGVSSSNIPTSSTTTTTVPLGADLTLHLGSVSGTTPGLRTLHLYIQNNLYYLSGLDVNSTFYIRSEAFYINNTSVGSCTTSLPSITSKTQSEATCQIYFSEKGNYTFNSKVDHTNLISELNENNNENSVPLELAQ